MHLHQCREPYYFVVWKTKDEDILKRVQLWVLEIPFIFSQAG